jgi:hypothetical protein
MQKSNDKQKRGRTKRETHDPVPKFKSLGEEIEFGETPGLTDYRDYWRVVKDLKIDFDPRYLRIEYELAQKINKVARQRGISSEKLMNL